MFAKREKNLTIQLEETPRHEIWKQGRLDEILARNSSNCLWPWFDQEDSDLEMRKTTIGTLTGRKRAGHSPRDMRKGLIGYFSRRELPLPGKLDRHMKNFGLKLFGGMG